MPSLLTKENELKRAQIQGLHRQPIEVVSGKEGRVQKEVSMARRKAVEAAVVTAGVVLVGLIVGCKGPQGPTGPPGSSLLYIVALVEPPDC